MKEPAKEPANHHKESFKGISCKRLKSDHCQFAILRDEYFQQRQIMLPKPAVSRSRKSIGSNHNNSSSTG